MVDMEVAQKPENNLAGDRFTCLTVAEIAAHLQLGEIDGEWPDGWWHDQRVFAAHRAIWREVIAITPPCPTHFAGRGIVICGGGERYLPGAWVCMRLLRHLGCQLPIELWHLGPQECDRRMCNLLAPWNVDCIDAWEIRKRHPIRTLRGWELKPYAIVHSRFREDLLLDADNCSVLDPTYLFHAQEYRDTGAIFWPDYERLGRECSLWEITEVDFRDEPECETGQILVDKLRTWPALWLALAFNAHSDFYYHHTMGDKDSFHLAFRRWGIDYAMPAYPVYNLGDRVMCQHDSQGQRIFQHRNLDKWRLTDENDKIEGFEHEALCREFLAELRGAWDGEVCAA